MLIQRGIHEFRDDDIGYQDWLTEHSHGYVINIARSYGTASSRLHRADCRTINGRNPRGGTWTGPYVKICAAELVELDQWATNQICGVIVRCGICRPTGVTGRSAFINGVTKAPQPQFPEWRSDIHGPTQESAVVHAWTDDYIRFQNLPPRQKNLRSQIRSRCGQLNPSPDQVLHATFFGPKPPNADVENLVLYNIGSFKVAGANGIRFEYGDEVPPAPDGAEYRFCYRYARAPRTGTLSHWREVGTLAKFDWTDLGAFASGKKSAMQVCLSIAGSTVSVGEPIAPESPFAVRLEVRPPYGLKPVWSGLVKSIFDGVICALQAHTGPPLSTNLLKKLAKDLERQPEDIEKFLLEPPWGVLGEVPALVYAYRSGVKVNPSDHLCVAGELIAAEPKPGDDCWRIKGQVVEVAR